MPNTALMTFAAKPSKQICLSGLRYELLSNQQQPCVLIFDDPELNPKLREVRTALFNKHIRPHFGIIYKFCWNYSYHRSHVKENYNEVLMNFYRKTTTYDTSRPIITWLHTVTRRYVGALERSRERHNNKDFNVDINNIADVHASNPINSNNTTCLDNYHNLYNDDILAALGVMNPNNRVAFLLQQDGYSCEEIMEMEWVRGALECKNVSTIRSRVFWAKEFMRRYITKSGNRKIN